MLESIVRTPRRVHVRIRVAGNAARQRVRVQAAREAGSTPRPGACGFTQREADTQKPIGTAARLRGERY